MRFSTNAWGVAPRAVKSWPMRFGRLPIPRVTPKPFRPKPPEDPSRATPGAPHRSQVFSDFPRSAGSNQNIQDGSVPKVGRADSSLFLTFEEVLDRYYSGEKPTSEMAEDAR